MRRVIAFDVNETLLDLRALDGLFGDAAARKRWFGQMLQLAFVGVITDRYVDFSTAQRAALAMLGDGPDPDEVAAAMRSLPLHADVGAGARPPARRRADAVLADELVARGLDRAAHPRGHRRPLRGDPVRRHGAQAEARAGALPPRGRDVRRRHRRRDARGLPRVGLRRRARCRLPGGVRVPARHGALPGRRAARHRGRRPRRGRRPAPRPSGCGRGRPCGPAPAAGRSPSAAPP